MIIKTGFLLSYDYKYLYTSLPLVYEHSDLIVLAVDKNRLSWSGNSFEIPEDFFKWIKDFDSQHKIKIYEDNFYIPTLKPLDNDTRERNLLGQFMGDGGWHIQIDSDEFFLNFSEFVAYLKSLDPKYLENPIKNPIEIHALWITLYKKVENGFLYIKDVFDSIEVATNLPIYECCRITDHKEKRITKFSMLHQSWAREDEAVKQKFKNWGHSGDKMNEKAYEIWKNLTLENYHTYKNFHASDPKKWKSLAFIAENEIDTLKIDITDDQIKKLILKKNIGNFVRKILPNSLLEILKSSYRKFVKKSI